MGEMTYFVQREAHEWTVGYDQWKRWGFKSQDQAVRAATAVAQQLARSGHETTVMLRTDEGQARALWASWAGHS